MNTVAPKLSGRVRAFPLYALLLMLLGGSYANAQPSDTTLRLVFAGDLMGHVAIHTGAQQGKNAYNYAPSFQYVKDYIQSADLAVINLEVTLGGAPYTGYPCFSAPDAYAAAARDAGFDIMTTANNHCMDRGKRGLERTIDVLDSLRIQHLGTYKNSRCRQEQHPLIVERNGIRLALLCYTYGTNGISVRQPNVVNMIDTAVMRDDLNAARRKQADYVIAIVHWGIEYQHHHNATQETLANWLLQNGCDAIIGSHPHVVQDIVSGTDGSAASSPQLVVYSLGNYLSNQRKKGCDGGIMVEMELRKSAGRTTLHNAAYLPFWVDRAVVDGRRQYILVPAADALENPVSYGLSDLSLRQMRLFYEHVTSVVRNTSSALRTPLLTFRTPFPIPETRFYYNRNASLPLLYTYQIIKHNKDFPLCPDTSYRFVYSFNRQSYVTGETPARKFQLRPVQYFDLAGHRVYFPDPTGGRGLQKALMERQFRSIDHWRVMERTDTRMHFLMENGLDRDTIHVFVRPSMSEANPVLNAPRFPGIVDSVSCRGGAVRYQLIRTEVLPRCHTPLPLEPLNGFREEDYLPTEKGN